MIEEKDLASLWAAPKGAPEVRVFIAYWFFVGWRALSFGLHVSFAEPNIEIHLPFGFVRIGWTKQPVGRRLINRGRKRAFGIGAEE